MLTRPRALLPGSHIAVLAASSPSDLPRIEAGARNLESRGFRVTLAGNIGHRSHRYLAGEDLERLTEVNRFFRSPEYDAFFFARGGYGAMRILDLLDYDALAADPRPVVGFSDVTAIHQALALRAGIGSFHGPMVNLDFHDGLDTPQEEWLWSLLAGAAPRSWAFDRSAVVRDGEAEGILFGGCLSLTAALTGTPYDYWPDGGIWFWEDVDEPPYRIDRMLTHLRLSGRMPSVRGVIIGALKNCGEEGEIRALLSEFFDPFRVPVVYGLPFGHDGNNLLMPIGAPARLSTSRGIFTITDPVVAR